MLQCDFEFGTLVEHARNPNLIDCYIVSPAAFRFFAVVECVTNLLRDHGVWNFQVLLNYGQPARQYRTAVQVKLCDATDKRRFMVPVNSAGFQRQQGRGRGSVQRAEPGAPPASRQEVGTCPQAAAQTVDDQRSS